MDIETTPEQLSSQHIQQEDETMDNYIIPEDDVDVNQYVNTINVFTVYFKKLFEKSPNYHMFSDIDYNKEQSTNRCMEYLYEEMTKLKLEKLDTKKEVYEVGGLDINNCKEMYMLYINNIPVKVCEYLLPLIYYIGELDWWDIDWIIIPILTNN